LGVNCRETLNSTWGSRPYGLIENQAEKRAMILASLCGFWEISDAKSAKGSKGGKPAAAAVWEGALLRVYG
jgi:hypothetical protein